MNNLQREFQKRLAAKKAEWTKHLWAGVTPEQYNNLLAQARGLDIAEEEFKMVLQMMDGAEE